MPSIVASCKWQVASLGAKPIFDKVDEWFYLPSKVGGPPFHLAVVEFFASSEPIGLILQLVQRSGGWFSTRVPSVIES